LKIYNSKKLRGVINEITFFLAKSKAIFYKSTYCLILRWSRPFKIFLKLKVGVGLYADQPFLIINESLITDCEKNTQLKKYFSMVGWYAADQPFWTFNKLGPYTQVYTVNSGRG